MTLEKDRKTTKKTSRTASPPKVGQISVKRHHIFSRSITHQVLPVLPYRSLHLPIQSIPPFSALPNLLKNIFNPTKLYYPKE